MEHPPLEWTIEVDVTDRTRAGGRFVTSTRTLHVSAATEQEALLTACQVAAVTTEGEEMVVAARIVVVAA